APGTSSGRRGRLPAPPPSPLRWGLRASPRPCRPARCAFRPLRRTCCPRSRPRSSSFVLPSVEYFLAQRLRRAHLVHAPEPFVLVVADAHGLVDFPTQRLDEHGQRALSLLVEDALRMYGDQFSQNFRRHPPEF